MTTRNSLTVSAYLGLTRKARNPRNLFAMDYNGDTEFIRLLAVSGRTGRPTSKSPGGFGSQTHAVIRNMATGRKSTLLMSTLIDRGLRKVGQASL